MSTQRGFSSCPIADTEHRNRWPSLVITMRVLGPSSEILRRFMPAFRAIGGPNAVRKHPRNFVKRKPAVDTFFV